MISDNVYITNRNMNHKYGSESFASIGHIHELKKIKISVDNFRFFYREGIQNKCLEYAMASIIFEHTTSRHYRREAKKLIKKHENIQKLSISTKWI